jgi:hypothetical protein
MRQTRELEGAIRVASFRSFFNTNQTSERCSRPPGTWYALGLDSDCFFDGKTGHGFRKLVHNSWSEGQLLLKHRPMIFVTFISFQIHKIIELPITKKRTGHGRNLAKNTPLDGVIPKSLASETRWDNAVAGTEVRFFSYGVHK